MSTTARERLRRANPGEASYLAGAALKCLACIAMIGLLAVIAVGEHKGEDADGRATVGLAELGAA